MYPWQFESNRSGGNAASALTWFLQTPRMNRFFLRDVIVNVIMYVPLGVAAYFAFQRLGRSLAALVAIAAGALLSFCVEMAQFYTPQRMPSVYDVIFNALGTMTGVVVAFTARSFLRHSGQAWTPRRDPVAFALLCCGIGYLLFPFFPLLSQTGVGRKVGLFLSAPWFATVLFFSSFLAWFLGGYLLTAATTVSRRWFPIALLALPAQFFVLGRQPLPSAVLGALAGVFLFLLIVTPRWAIVALAAIGVVLLRGLEPFRGQFALHPANSFTFTPFGGVLAADWQNGLFILIEKAFFYGATVWACTRAGLGLWLSVALLAVITAGTELAQIYMPGRTPEITDPLLVLLIGYIMRVFQRWQFSTATVRHG